MAGAKPSPQERHYFDQAGGSLSNALPTWIDVDSELLHKFVECVTLQGDACTFGRTSDGGALMVSVLSSGKVSKAYFPSVEALENRLRATIELL